MLAPEAAVTAVREHPVAPAAIATIWERHVALVAAMAAIWERPVAPAAAVEAIQERYRGLEAAVAASGSVARPVTGARGVAEAGSAAFAAICDVDRSESACEARGDSAPNSIIN